MLRIMLIGGEIMLLLADGDVAQGATLVTCLMAFMASLFAWLSARDKLKYDVKVVTLENKTAVLEGHVSECQTDRDALKLQNADQQRQLNDNRQQIGTLNAKIEALTARLSPTSPRGS